jgi:hypothetical protein
MDLPFFGWGQTESTWYLGRYLAWFAGYDAGKLQEHPE